MGYMRSAPKIFLLLIFCTSSTLAQDASAPVSAYVDAGIGLYGNLGRANPNFDFDGGADITHRKLFAEVEAGADTANGKGTGNGYTIRTHGLLFYHPAGNWSFGGGLYFAEFSTSAFKEHDVWPSAGLLFNGEWLRANMQYLFPGSNSNYHETGPFVDLRLHIVRGFYLRERLAVLHYSDRVETPPQGHFGAEATFGVLYVFHDKR